MAAATLDGYAPESAHVEDWDLAGLAEGLHRQFDVRMPAATFEEIASRAALDEAVDEAVKSRYAEREQELGTSCSAPSSVTRC
jgi:preprotein translocase subunit SecA